MSAEPSRRRAVRVPAAPGPPAPEPPVERQPGIWRIRSHAVARQVLTARGATSQAGFTSEHVPTGFLKHHPILFSDGPQHDEQRRKVGRYFAPAVVRERYGQVMDDAADALVTDAVGRGRCRVDQIALLYSVEVTRQVVGLTESSIEGLAGRLVKFFNQPPFDITQPDLGRTRRQWAMAAVNGLGPIARFHLADVRPAIRARRRERRADVISHLLDEGYTSADILVECLTYGTAGMVTTREFIAMALWHLLTDTDLRQAWLAADQPDRLALLEEVIRLEPVVGHLYRRVREPLEVVEGGQRWRFEPGDLLDLDVGAANLDPAAMGADPGSLCPGRSLAKGVHAAGLSFGDGAHRCPGQPMALLETDVLLGRLLAEQPVIITEPRVEWDDLVAGYCLRGFEVGFNAATASPR